MSKVPDQKNGQSYSKIPPPRSKDFGYYGKYTNTGSPLTCMKQNNASEPDLSKSVQPTPNEPPKEIKKPGLCKTFQSFIPKMSLHLEKVTEQNPRILDLRQKLNEITKKQDRNVDKQTKALINNITQRLDDKNESDSGPYSLLFELQSEPSTSEEKSNSKVMVNKIEENPADCKTRMFGNKLPSVVDFDNKPMKEFEYSCESELNVPPNKTFNHHSRSDLCLHFKPHAPSRFENTTPNENSVSRTNEENSLDDSLGILTPDQMDDICYLDNAFSPTVEGLPIFCDNDSKNSPDNGDTPSTDKTESNSAASTMFLQNDDMTSKDKNHEEIQPLVSNFNPNIPSLTIKPSESSDAIHGDDFNYERHLMYNTSEGHHHVSTPSDCFVNVKEEFVTSLLEDEILPSIQSSILEPASSVADTTVNLDLPLDCKQKESRLATHRIEQTPSPEDLPLDSSDLHGEISTYSNSQFSTSTLHDSHTYSDIKNDFTKSIETSKVSNSFITSITSITSLDGYQGDGEMSRPVSRGADHSIREEIMEMDWQNVPVTRRADPMTDSDFFTESDADGLDDHMHRGDRKAQVIDGALYGGKNNNGNPPLIVNRNEDSCMDSSGVYTDLENHRSSPVFLNAIDDMSPGGSSVSTQSECSQKNGNQANDFYDNDVKLKVQSPSNEDNNENSKIDINMSPMSNKENCKDIIPKEEKKCFTLKKYKMPKRDVPSKIKTIMNRKADVDSSVQNSPKNVRKTDRRENLAKKNSSIEIKNDYKTKSFKDIKSKVDCSFSIQRSQTACSVTRLLSSKSTNSNTKPKSRHMRMRMELGSANGSGKSSLHSSQSDISASSTPLAKHSTSRFPLLRNGKKRETTATPQSTPVHAPVSPQQPPTIVKKNGVAVVQKLASSPVSVRARTSLAPPPSPRKPAARRAPAQRPSTLPTNTKEPPRVTAAVGPRGKRAGPQTPQGPPARSSPAPRPPSPIPAPVASPKATEQAAALANAAKGVEALGVLVQYLVFRLDALNSGAWKSEAVRWRGVAAAEKSSAALAALDRKQRAQKDFDTIAECSTRISELEMEVLEKEKVNARLVAAGEEANNKYRSALHEISTLAADIKGLKDTIESLKRDVAESRQRLHAQGEIERTLRAQLDAARDELARSYENSRADGPACEATNAFNTSVTRNEYNGHGLSVINGFDDEVELKVNTKGELSTDPSELAAEVQSLRVVLELKQAEAASLRSARTELLAERERRTHIEREARAARHAAEELRERAIARQRDADILKDENRRLREAAARDRDHAARLSTLNEELRYKLRQNSQVLSLITGGSLRTRTVSNDSARSPSPGPDTPPSPAASPAPDTPPVPAVKGVVEKHDSVSWVLEIEESPEEVASRLARRSSFRTAASPSGVKRRGGASPGNGSPAPASPAPNASKLFRPGELDFPPPPPPLKESAGEAIYIYDDRQY